MSVPTLTVRIGFASNPLANPQTWTDVSHDAIALHIARGRQHALDRIEAGTATVILRNLSNQYWPDNTNSPYTGNIKPGKCINLRATYGGNTYDLFTGFIESWQPSWQEIAGRCPMMTLTCADLIKNLSRFEITGAGYAQELSGTRVGNVLDSYGWDAALRDIDTGSSTILATGAMANVNAWEHLSNVQDTERGQVFIDGDGNVVFHDRPARLASPYNTSQATFGDDTGENIYRNIEPSYDDDFIFNSVSITRTGGTVQTATDAASQTTYGPRAMSKSSLLMTADSEALSQAQYLVGQYKDAVLRAKSLTIWPQRDEANLYPKALGHDIATRITLRLNQASLDKDYHIEGVTHDYDARDGVWVTSWQLSDADNKTYWSLGDTGFSELGDTTILFY